MNSEQFDLQFTGLHASVNIWKDRDKVMKFVHLWTNDSRHLDDDGILYVINDKTIEKLDSEIRTLQGLRETLVNVRNNG